ncbi:glutathione S-transferase [soil metagenome]
MKLYQSPLSSNSRKTSITAKLLRSPVELVHVDLMKREHLSPEFLTLNPNAAVPVLVDGAFVLTESNAIMIYLCEIAGDAGEDLHPPALKPRSQVDRWLFWMSSHWGPTIAALNFEHNLKKLLKQGEADSAHVLRSDGMFKKFASVLDAELGRREFVAGDSLSIADIAIAAPLMYASAAKLPIESYKNIGTWFERITALPAWKETEPSF